MLENPKDHATLVVAAEESGDVRLAERRRQEMEDLFGPDKTRRVLEELRPAGDTEDDGPRFAAPARLAAGGWQTSRDIDRRRPPIVQA